mgnify:CR=1 FL=1
MPDVLSTVLPVFGIILGGFLTAHFRLLPEGTGKGLADFVFGIAMPALLFRTMATVGTSGVPALGLLFGFFIANALVWLLTTVITLRVLRRPLADAPAICMGACFGNTVMLGLPLGTAHFGEKGAAAIAVIVAMHAPVLWIAATIQQEWSLHEGKVDLAAKLRSLTYDLLTNPVVFGVLAGSLWRTTGLGIAEIPDRMISLIGQAGIPGSLFALGMSLTLFEVKTGARALVAITMLKLLVMPLTAWVISHHVLGLPPLGVGVVTLLAACPTGANAFLFASRYERAVGSVSGAVAIGTALSIISISALLLALGPPA